MQSDLTELHKGTSSPALSDDYGIEMRIKVARQTTPTQSTTETRRKWFELQKTRQEVTQKTSLFIDIDNSDNGSNRDKNNQNEEEMSGSGLLEDDDNSDDQEISISIPTRPADNHYTPREDNSTPPPLPTRPTTTQGNGCKRVADCIHRSELGNCLPQSTVVMRSHCQGGRSVFKILKQRRAVTAHPSDAVFNGSIRS